MANENQSKIVEWNITGDNRIKASGASLVYSITKHGRDEVYYTISASGMGKIVDREFTSLGDALEYVKRFENRIRIEI